MTTANWKPMHMFVSVNNGERGVFGLIELWVVASSPLSKEINTWKKKKWLRANTFAIRNSKPKTPNQKHTNKAHITLVHIYIHTWPHTHKNSNTQAHGQTTINTHTRHNQERDRKRKRKFESEKLGGTIQYCNLKT